MGEKYYSRNYSVRCSNHFTCITSFNYYTSFMMLVMSIAPRQTWGSLTVHVLSTVTRQISSRARIGTLAAKCVSADTRRVPPPCPFWSVVCWMELAPVACKTPLLSVSSFERSLLNTVPLKLTIVETFIAHKLANITNQKHPLPATSAS